MTRIEQIKALCEAATGGEWVSEQHDHSYTVYPKTGVKDGIVTSYGHYATQSKKMANCEFIAQSRQLVPELLDLLEGMGEALRLYLDEHDNTYDGEGMSQEKYAALEKMRNSKDKFDAWNRGE